MASRGAHDFLDPDDASLDEPVEWRSAGRRANPDDMPQFGPLQLVQQIDSAEKIVKEVDRQLRSGSTVRNVVRRSGGDGSVSYEAGAGVLSQAAVGEDIKCYTDLVSERYSETGRKNDQERTGEESFEVQEATIVPNRAGMSILMFDLCCSKGRRATKKKRQAVPLDSVRSCGPEYVDPAQLERGPGGRGWDPQRDAHLYREQNRRPHGWEEEEEEEGGRRGSTGRGRQGGAAQRGGPQGGRQGAEERHAPAAHAQAGAGPGRGGGGGWRAGSEGAQRGSGRAELFRASSGDDGWT